MATDDSQGMTRREALGRIAATTAFGVAAVLSGHDELQERSEVTGTTTNPDGTTAPHTIHFYDSGVDGVRLRPAVNATDLPVIVDDVVPLLQRAGRFRTAYEDGETLRHRLGLPIAENRYAQAKP